MKTAPKTDILVESCERNGETACESNGKGVNSRADSLLQVPSTSGHLVGRRTPSQARVCPASSRFSPVRLRDGFVRLSVGFVVVFRDSAARATPGISESAGKRDDPLLWETELTWDTNGTTAIHLWVPVQVL